MIKVYDDMRVFHCAMKEKSIEYVWVTSGFIRLSAIKSEVGISWEYFD